LLFPTPSGVRPKRSVLRVHRVPLKLAAFFDLFFEERFFVHGSRPIERGRLIAIETAPIQRRKTSRQPILITL